MPHLIDDAAAPADRGRERHVARRGQQAHGRPQADGEDDEADGEGQDPAPAGSAIPADARPSEGSALSERGTNSAVVARNADR